jgi:uncharacterized protein (TIGR02147 family)
MTLFDFDNFAIFLKTWIKSQAHGGRGMNQQLAKHLGISTVLMSQILTEKRQLNPEHALQLCQFLGLTELETKCFIAMVNLSRAGSKKLQDFYRRELSEIKRKADNLKTRLQVNTKLNNEAKAEFYSHWTYSSVRLLSTTSDQPSPDAIAAKLSIPRQEVVRIQDFLLQQGLLIQKNAAFELGTQHTHLEADSPYIISRQIQWRLKSFEQMNHRDPEQIFFTSPMTISKSDLPVLRKKILSAIDELLKVAKSSGSEELVCINIDYFKV